MAPTERDNYPPSTGDAHQRINLALHCIAQAMGEGVQSMERVGDELAHARKLLEQLIQRDVGDTTVGDDG